MSDPLVKGTLDLLILRTLAPGALHGAAIADRLFAATKGTFDVKPGSLFPALHRLEADGWIEGRWDADEAGRRIKSYTLTRAGRKQLSSQEAAWRRIVAAMNAVLGSARS